MKLQALCVQNGVRETWDLPRHKANCPNRKAKYRKKFDGCRVYARLTNTDPLTGKLLEEINGALPPHITTQTAADTDVSQRFGLVIEEYSVAARFQLLIGA